MAIETGPPAGELTLRSSDGPGAPLGDFDLSDRDTSFQPEDLAELDLGRVIGGDRGDTGDVGAAGAPLPPAPPVSPATRAPAAPLPPVPPATRAPAAPPPPVPPVPPGELPLFGGQEDTPLVTAPRPVRAPLSVRRTTPEIPRVRPRRSQPSPSPDDGALAFQLESGRGEPQPSRDATGTPELALTPASPVARLGAAAIDAALLGVINVTVVYLTLALAGLTWQEYAVVPVAPLVGFFAILNGGYLIGFIAAAGQTIGKMVTDVRVLADDGQRVDITSAVLRAVGCGASLLTLGLGYLPAFFTAERRALQDRIAGTRVFRAR
ncbi:MAG TPA: RDD family protein [Vicinamibacterales bacterium]|nr:RDD family protein [Vicinamibacterales bacterium]